jgi:G3E family GTPase
MDMLGTLVTTQVKDADIIAISKVDAVDEAAVNDSAKRIREYNTKAEIINLSSFKDLGIDELAQRIIDWQE